MATMTLTFSELTEQIEKRVLAEQRIKELEAKLSAVELAPPKKVRKQKELTPEEAEELHTKRVEAGKKGAAKRAEKAALKKEQEREALLLEAKAIVQAEIKALEESSEIESETSEHQELV
jgi:hypothetical protein